jgi:hypothetical protein
MLNIMEMITSGEGIILLGQGVHRGPKNAIQLVLSGSEKPKKCPALLVCVCIIAAFSFLAICSQLATEKLLWLIAKEDFIFLNAK